MKQTLLLMIAAVTLIATISSGTAQDRAASETKTSSPNPPAAPSAPAAGNDRDAATPSGANATTSITAGRTDTPDGNSARHHRASEIIGMDIVNRQNEKVGAVSDLAIDFSGQRVTAVIISSGGFLGIANELSIVPPTALMLNVDGKQFTSELTKDLLTDAPRFQGSEFPNLNDRDYLAGVYKAYSAEPYLEKIDRGADEGTRRILRASELLGMNVDNYQDDTIGEIHDLILNSRLDRVNAVVVSSGGFLGVGEQLSVLPVGAVSTTKDAVLVNATKETLEKSPRFTTASWPENMNDPGYLVDVYSPYEYRSDTKSDVDINASADNAKTDRPRTTETVDDTNAARKTAQDQSNNLGDVSVSTNIRKRLVSDDDLSFSAKNVRVITYEGKVTLAGQVSSKEELDRVLEIANEEAGSEKVTNQLTVKE